MLQRVSSRELSEWMAYSRLEPWGPERQEFMIAQLTALVANALRGKGGKTYRTEDYMPKYGPRKKQTWQHQMTFMRALAEAQKAHAAAEANTNKPKS